MSGLKDSQCKQILEHMEKYGSITPMDAIECYGCLRLGARIFDLKKKYVIETVMESGKNRFGKETRYARYSLVGERKDYE